VNLLVQNQPYVHKQPRLERDKQPDDHHQQAGRYALIPFAGLWEAVAG
jgi:hypothetical protein